MTVGQLYEKLKAIEEQEKLIAEKKYEAFIPGEKHRDEQYLKYLWSEEICDEESEK